MPSPWKIEFAGIRVRRDAVSERNPALVIPSVVEGSLSGCGGALPTEKERTRVVLPIVFQEIEAAGSDVRSFDFAKDDTGWGRRP